jgi:hypothetical protein
LPRLLASIVPTLLPASPGPSPFLAPLPALIHQPSPALSPLWLLSASLSLPPLALLSPSGLTPRLLSYQPAFSGRLTLHHSTFFAWLWTLASRPLPRALPRLSLPNFSLCLCFYALWSGHAKRAGKDKGVACFVQSLRAPGAGGVNILLFFRSFN